MTMGMVLVIAVVVLPVLYTQLMDSVMILSRNLMLLYIKTPKDLFLNPEEGLKSGLDLLLKRSTMIFGNVSVNNYDANQGSTNVERHLLINKSLRDHYFPFIGILVRNNLTGIELVTFAGESVLGEFKFGKFRHDHHSSKGVEEERESAILEFDMKEKHLKDCDRKYQNLIQVCIFQTQIFLSRFYAHYN